MLRRSVVKGKAPVVVLMVVKQGSEPCNCPQATGAFARRYEATSKFVRPSQLAAG
jgi:hypothetical protein